MNESIVEKATHTEANYHEHWMTLHYTIGRDLWIIATVHMPTSWQSSERFNDTLYDLDKVMENIAAGKRTQPRVLGGGGWKAAWPAPNGILESYYELQADDRAAMICHLFMKWNVSRPVDCVGGNVEDQWTYQTTAGRQNLIDYIVSSEPYYNHGLAWNSDHRLVKCTTEGRNPEVYTFNEEIEPTLKNWNVLARRLVPMREVFRRDGRREHRGCPEHHEGDRGARGARFE